MYRTLILIIGCLLVFSGKPQIIKAYNIAKATIEVNKIPDFCSFNSSEKQVIIILTIGEVTLQDSLYGFNFQLSYDTNKISIIDMLTINTLAENCDWAQGDVDEGGIYRGAATNLGLKRMSGNKPLIAVSAEIKSSCIDTININLDLLEFTTEFVKDSVELTNYNITTQKLDLPERYYKIELSKDSIISNTDNDFIVKIKKNEGFKYNSISFKINDPSNLLSEKMDIIENRIKDINYDIENSIISLISESFIPSSEMIELSIKSFEEVEGFIEFIPIDNNCQCFTRFASDTLYVNIKKQSSVSEKVEIVNEDLWIDNKNNELVQIRIFNLFGQEVDKINIRNIEKYFVNLKTFEKGIYPILLEDEKGNVRNKIVIKN